MPNAFELSIGRCILLVPFGFMLISLLAPFTAALYEDQIGKFDWKRTQIGAIRNAAFHGSAGERIIVSTEHNVLAALHTKSGDIEWRKLLERNERGDIRFFHVTSAGAAAAVSSSNVPAEQSDMDDDDLVITVSGNATSLVRGWNAQTGHSEWEWSITTSDHVDEALWAYDDGILYHIVPVWSSHIELTSYYARSGQSVRGKTERVSAPWIRKSSCVVTQTLFVCVAANNSAQLLAIELTTEHNELRKFPLSGIDLGHSFHLRVLPEAIDTVILNEHIYALRNASPLQAAKVQFGSSAFVVRQSNVPDLLLQATTQGNALRLVTVDLQSSEHWADIDATIDHTPHGADTPVRVLDVLCRRKSPDSAPACRVLLSTQHGAILLVQQGRIKWTREESLADIVAVEMIDLELSDDEGSIESKLKNKDGNIVDSLVRRVAGQFTHIRHTVIAVLGLGSAPSVSQSGLVRDAFGLHKMLVILTANGKLFGIDNESGDIHWKRVLPDFTGFNAGQSMQIVVQRTARHFPLATQCLILARHQHTGNGVVFQFNPISGQPISNGYTALPYAIRQVALTAHVRPTDFVRAVVLLDQQNGAHVIPSDAAEQANDLYLFAADAETGIINGFNIRYARKTNSLETRSIWEVNVSGTSSSSGPQRIVRLATKNRIERVHSQGRVFNDRSVLYKYINPNLVAVATIGPDAVHKSVLNVHLLDVVSGAIVNTMSHSRVREPVHIVNSENWLVYTYFNEKLRRTEVTTVELYEGKTQANGTVWSSLNAPQLPMLERQSYILPANVVAMRETITERGITNKHVLFALSTGSVVEMPWALLDPRRPVLLPNQPREEGIVPYIPELPVPSDNVINYNQSVAHVQNIAVAPSGLESTCLVIAYGLDIFVTRVAPSKTFDLLKEDFDYMLIMVVLIGLSAASVVVRQLSARKTVKQAWK